MKPSVVQAQGLPPSSSMNEILRVLLIDDDDVDRMAVRRCLSKTQFHLEVVEAANAAIAKDYLLNETFDCICLDYRLPDDDGLSLVKRLRKDGFNLPIIVLTGQGDEQTAVELMKAGASDYLSKSRLSSDGLAKVLRQALRVYRAEQKTRVAQEQLRQTNLLLRQQNKELEDQRHQIEQQNLRLLEADRHKSEFLATVTHELRTPLNSIMGFSQILRGRTKGPLNSYQLEMVNRIFSNGQSLLNLVNDILDMSTIEANRLKLMPDFFDLEALVRETFSEMQPLAQEKSLETRLIINLNNRVVYNDRQRLKQILVNLLSNAIKFTDDGYVQIKVKMAGLNSIEILVEDTGIGITEEKLDFIFHPFRQGDQTTQRRYPGTGLGLAITHSLVGMMEGLISVSSELGHGTCFQVQIPRRIADQPDSRLDYSYSSATSDMERSQ
ncbi:ATP-binding protein [Oscillatoria sp. CS-180]|uniref:ATP-binding response regulator n=1 Tax=Oscillatoria sp. CS-180 TaxID=3021720 RepID=UPI00232EFEB3|nr:hybrid sensor histidine kinase/response regulator [Oscillatoria sp. CS-180]MDB9524879.1 ATP-binding protein [Oscillatoria sp. CS-180]